MARPRNVVPARRITFSIPETEGARLDILLYSDGEGRIPFRSYQEFLLRAIRDAWELKPLDLSPYCGTPPGAFIIRGDDEAIRILKQTLEKGE